MFPELYNQQTTWHFETNKINPQVHLSANSCRRFQYETEPIEGKISSKSSNQNAALATVRLQRRSDGRVTRLELKKYQATNKRYESIYSEI